MEHEVHYCPQTACFLSLSTHFYPLENYFNIILQFEYIIIKTNAYTDLQYNIPSWYPYFLGADTATQYQ